MTVDLNCDNWIDIEAARRRFPISPTPADERALAIANELASEAEKRRLARVLYDDVGQRLSVLKLDLNWLEQALPKATKTLSGRLAEMQGLLDNVITVTKSIASTLRPPILDDFGLVPAIQWIVDSCRKRTAISCKFRVEGQSRKLDHGLESAVFRVVQEALSNIERHSHASRANVELRITRDSLEIEITDDGIGIRRSAADQKNCFGSLQ